MSMPAIAASAARAWVNRIEPSHTKSNPVNMKDTIQVRSLSLLSCKSQIERLARYLCPDEREKAARFHFQRDHDRFVAARALLRLQLGAFLHRDPKTLLFDYTSYGKPFIKNCRIEFNLSHSGDWVLFAFSHSAEIGVDIEQIRPLPDMPDVARQNFSAAEFALWQAASAWDRTQAFYRCWTRKESFIKAIGEGLSCPLDSFEVAFGLDQPARLTSLKGDESLAAQWWMADLPDFPGYAAAVTARTANLNDMDMVVSEANATDFLDNDLLR
jgi:4'-phosphopantetheinyl transferase